MVVGVEIVVNRFENLAFVYTFYAINLCVDVLCFQTTEDLLVFAYECGKMHTGE